MTKIGIIRCEKNELKCPLTGCFKSLNTTTQGFEMYEEAELVGVFTCRCPGDNVQNLAKILKAKGAEAIHMPTCLFANKTKEGWKLEGGGFCDKTDQLLDDIHEASGLPCVKGAAHLPKGYTPETR